MTIRVGTAGWHYDDWNGVVYPKPRPRGFDPLESLSGIFDALEVNVTFYRIPPPAMVASWPPRVAANPRFRFTVKVPRTFTHDRPGLDDPSARASLDAEEGQFREALAPLIEAERLGAILLQFPQSFHPTEDDLAYLEALLIRFEDLPCVAEFRHAGWAHEDVLALLRRRGAGFCNIDQPRLGSTLGPTETVTGPVAYARLHGRNAADWFREDAGRERRYDYLYTEAELAPWVERIRKIAESVPDTYVIANNHFRGKAAVNALQIKAALEGSAVDVPAPLLTEYPQLAPIAKPPPDTLPFD